MCGLIGGKQGGSATAAAEIKQGIARTDREAGTKFPALAVEPAVAHGIEQADYARVCRQTAQIRHHVRADCLRQGRQLQKTLKRLRGARVRAVVTNLLNRCAAE